MADPFPRAFLCVLDDSLRRNSLHKGERIDRGEQTDDRKRSEPMWMDAEIAEHAGWLVENSGYLFKERKRRFCVRNRRERYKAQYKYENAEKRDRCPVEMPPGTNFATPPTRTRTPRTINPIARGRSLTGRGARGFDSGLGGGGAWKLDSFALIDSSPMGKSLKCCWNIRLVTPPGQARFRESVQSVDGPTRQPSREPEYKRPDGPVKFRATLDRSRTLVNRDRAASPKATA